MNDLWREVTRLRNSIAELAETIRKHDEALANCIGRMKAEIEKGGTTGDLILDFFITQFGTIDEETMKPLRELEEKMAGKVGQLFLVIQNCVDTRYRFGNGGEDDKEYYLRVDGFVLGMLSGSRLIFSGRRYGFPTLEHCTDSCDKRAGHYLFPSDRGIHESNIVTAGSQSRPRFEVFIGDDEVFRVSSRAPLIRGLARALGKEVPE